MTRKTISLGAEVARPQVENEYGAVLLTAGTHPVTGYKDGLTFLADDLVRAAESMNGKPVNLNHSRSVEDEVGFVKDAKVVDGRLRATLVLAPSTAKFGIAKAFIENRQTAGAVPEVSVGVLYVEERLPNGAVLARDLAFDHLALVSRGACSPERGCGVGLSKETVNMDNPTPEAAPAAAPEAQPAPEAAPAAPPAEPQTAPLAADKPPCGCHELERALLAEKEAHAKASADLAEEVKARSKAQADYAALAASIPERLVLLQKARDLGVDATGAEDIAVLTANLAIAEKAAAKVRADLAAAKPAPAAPATGPAKGADLKQETVADKARALLKAGGLELR